MKKIVETSLSRALATLAYIAIVVSIMLRGEALFGKMEGALGAMAFLLLFTISALVVSILALGRPISLYFADKKTEAIKHLIVTILWLALFFVIILSIRIFL